MSDGFVVEPSSDPDDFFRVEQAIGWPRARLEIARRVDLSRGFVARAPDGEPVGVATLTTYLGASDEPALAWVGGMGVLPAWRGHGVGKRLLGACLTAADADRTPSVCLDATPAGRPLYEKLGFRAAGGATRWSRASGTPQPRPSPRHSVHPVSLSEAMEIAEYDAPRFGARRIRYLLAVLRDYPWQAFMSRERASGRVSGFALGQDRAVGPIVADDAGAAAALLAACELAGAPATALCLDRQKDAAALLVAAGYAPVGAGVTRMVRGADPPMRDEFVYASGSWALG